MKYLKLILMFTLLMTNPSWAGVGSSGGGDVIICGKNVYLADTFRLTRYGYFAGLEDKTKEEVLSLFFSNIKQTDPELGKEIQTRLKELNFAGVKKVPDVDDDDIQLEERGCKKKQLALQVIENKTVTYNKEYYASLTEADKAFFELHETLISLRKKPGDKTWFIRKELRHLLETAKIIKLITASEEVVSKITTAIKLAIQAHEGEFFYNKDNKICIDINNFEFGDEHHSRIRFARSLNSAMGSVFLDVSVPHMASFDLIDSLRETRKNVDKYRGKEPHLAMITFYLNVFNWFNNRMDPDRL